MSFTPRPYQADAIEAIKAFFNEKKKYNAIAILPTGSGKSVVIAETCNVLEGKKILVLQPSKEILVQNYAKYVAQGRRAAIYSASAGHKFVDRVTFATIGSIINKLHLFKDVDFIIIDECHYVNADDGMYKKLIETLNAKVLGLTATPYRLEASFEGAMLKFLNRTNPRIFNKVIYYVQTGVLFESGHLAKLEYYSFNVIDRTMLTMNNSGTDFTEASLRAHYRQIDMPKITIEYANRILSKRKSLLVFSSLIEEAEKVAKGVPGAVVITGETEQSKRDSILAQFKQGKIRCVINVGVLTTGFDYPELEAVLIARSTMSLALYYQIVGRAMRIHPSKENAWIVDLGGNINFFGKIETMEVKVCEKGLYSIWNNGRQLTNVSFTKN